jgi:two-component system response regulator RegX3
VSTGPCGRGQILIVEDDPHTAELLTLVAGEEGYTPIVARDGPMALRRARDCRPDLVVLDVGLPGLDGFEVCRRLRKESAVPVIIVSARQDEIDKVVGLEVGADDYLTKPFSARELRARLRAVLRRAGAEPAVPGTVRQRGDLCVNADARAVSVAGRAVRLKPKEFEVLWLLVKNEGRVFTRDQLIAAVWGFDFEGDPRTVDVHIRRIRRALGESGAAPRYLHTVHGVGYKFAVPT